MKKTMFFAVVIVVGSVCLVTANGCTDKKPSGPDSVSWQDSVADSIPQNLTVETENAPMPKGADELFDDFIFNFASNGRLQRERIVFPLPMKADATMTKITKDKWKTENFFMRQGYYTLIFDNEKQFEIVNDTSIDHVIVEKVYLNKKSVQQFDFHRINGRWMLTEIINGAMYQNHNASFLSFYEQFARDRKFQISSLNVPVSMVLPDPDDDFKMMNADLYPEQWEDFKPQILPKDFIYNIIYSQKYTNSNQKVFVIRGIANGYETQMTFKKMKNGWKLVKMIA